MIAFFSTIVQKMFTINTNFEAKLVRLAYPTFTLYTGIPKWIAYRSVDGWINSGGNPTKSCRNFCEILLNNPRDYDVKICDFWDNMTTISTF